MTAKKDTTKKGAPKPDLPDMLAAVLSHPELPYCIWDAVTDALSNLGMTTAVYEDPYILRTVFFANLKAKKAARKGGAR